MMNFNEVCILLPSDIVLRWNISRFVILLQRILIYSETVSADEVFHCDKLVFTLIRIENGGKIVISYAKFCTKS